MMSKSIIFENIFVLVGYFSGIPLSVRVKIPILRDTLKISVFTLINRGISEK